MTRLLGLTTQFGMSSAKHHEIEPEQNCDQELKRLFIVHNLHIHKSPNFYGTWSFFASQNTQVETTSVLDVQERPSGNSLSKMKGSSMIFPIFWIHIWLIKKAIQKNGDHSTSRGTSKGATEINQNCIF